SNRFFCIRERFTFHQLFERGQNFEPSADKPERIRVSGVFITAGERSDVYSAPQRGYLYFALPKANDELALKEWADLKSIAGSRQVVGLCSSRVAKVRVRKSDEEAKSPDDYPMGNGLVKVNPDQPRAKALLDYKERFSPRLIWVYLDQAISH